VPARRCCGIADDTGRAGRPRARWLDRGRFSRRIGESLGLFPLLRLFGPLGPLHDIGR